MVSVAVVVAIVGCQPWIMSSYQVDQVEQDVRAFVASLLQHGVIELR